MKLEDWFEKNKFKAQSFSNLKRLLRLKREKKQTISLVIPTLNEKETVGNVIRVIKSKLMDKFGLIDEIVVVDSGSTDRTEKIVKSSGAKFFLASDILKRYGPAKGKGENLWKSLYATEGSILVFLDADIKNIHPRFIYGLVGPLLTHDKIAYTKAFYRYYKKLGVREKIRGWGRMTELLLRPLLNMFFPELTGIIQASSGQSAGRRKILEKLSFFTGYGVELGLLTEIKEKFGLKSIAQVDLGKLRHRYRDTGDKGLMGFGILQVFCKKANLLGKLILLDKIRKSYRLIEYSEEEDTPAYKIKKVSLKEKERPPMVTVKSYRRKFNKSEYKNR